LPSVCQLREELAPLEPTHGSLRARVLAAILPLDWYGSGSEEAVEALLPQLGGPSREERLRAVEALRLVLHGTGAEGLALLARCRLDDHPPLRDYLPELTGACGADDGGALVEGTLLEALAHPSPGRRKSALRGLAVAFAGSARDDLVDPIASAAAHPTDFTLALEALHAVGRMFQGALTPRAYEVATTLLLPREVERSLDAGWNPYGSLARAARGTALGPRFEAERLLPAITLPGASLRRGRLRRAGIEAWAELHRAEGLSALTDVRDMLADPIRATRHAALWELTALMPEAPGGGDVAGLAEGLIEWSAASPRAAAFAALCLGALLEANPRPEAHERLLTWARWRDAELRPYALLALARMHRGRGEGEAGEAIRSALPERGGADRLVALAIGSLFASRPDPWAHAQLARLAARRRPAATQAAAIAGLGMVHAGEGLAAGIGLLAGLRLEPAVLDDCHGAHCLVAVARGLTAYGLERYHRAFRGRLLTTGLGESR
jgi:hypothetical protein